jgi:beta-glucanase (GH16 family)
MLPRSVASMVLVLFSLAAITRADPSTPPRTKPKNGSITGPAIPFNVAQQLAAPGLATDAATLGVDGSITVKLQGSTPDQTITLHPEAGTWDLSDALEVKVTLLNAGSKPITPSIRLESGTHPDKTPIATLPVAATAPLQPGATATITAPFFQAAVLTGDNGKTIQGSAYASNVTSGITILPGTADPAGAISIISVMADLPPAPKLPDWLGKLPPPDALKDGAWKQTLSEDFDGTTLNTALWNTTMNYSDEKQIHLASAHAILMHDGTAIMRFSKTPTHEFDDPTRRLAAYQSAWLDTYGKWRQRYGYFECRVKAPTGPDIFPAFWLMPDRGGSDPQWVRQSTKDGGMEFDIFEKQTRWGPYRHDVGAHWDGYGKQHKSNGIFNIYTQPDNQGYITCGMLWVPGKIIYYDNGHEVLRWEDGRISNVPSCLILDNVCGGWDHDPMDDRQLPQDLVVDYVRVWQRNDLASLVDGPMTTPTH